MASGGSDQVQPRLGPAHGGQHCQGHNHQEDRLLVHVPPKHETGPCAEGERAEEGGERVGREPELGQGGQERKKHDYSCGGGGHGREDGVVDVLHQTSGHACGGNIHGQLAKSLAYHSQHLVCHVIESPEVGRPIGMAETSFEGKQAREHLW